VNNIIEVKNRPNWLMTIFGAITLIIITFAIVVIIPLATVQETYFLSILSFLISVIPFLLFFFIILYLWLWNTFGKTILEKKGNEIIVTKKWKLFSKSRSYSHMQKIIIKNYKIEKSGYYTRYNFSLGGAVNSIVFIINSEEIRIIDWLTEKRAKDILRFIND
jgi:energy-coupling factor transporter transmembrane protein EcfT